VELPERALFQLRVFPREDDVDGREQDERIEAPEEEVVAKTYGVSPSNHGKKVKKINK
jgi:hypothetical protein